MPLQDLQANDRPSIEGNPLQRQREVKKQGLLPLRIHTAKGAYKRGIRQREPGFTKRISG
jgi:hypothetical protein